MNKFINGFGVDKRITKMNKLPKQMLLVCVFLLALTEQSMADSLVDALEAKNEGDYEKAVKLFKPMAERGG